MNHSESLREFEHIMDRESQHARETATELEALVLVLRSEKSRKLAQVQIKASHKKAREFRELADQVKET